MDCSSLLCSQLAEVAALIPTLMAPGKTPDPTRLFGDLSTRAVLHVLSRERLLAPAWRRADGSDIPLESTLGHARLKKALAALLVETPGTAGFHAALEAFGLAVDQQKRLDDEHFIPAFRTVVDLEQRRQLCNDIELFFEIGAPTGPAPVAAAHPGPP